MARKNTANVHNASSSGGGVNDHQHVDDPSQNPSSPYFVHPSENPGAILVTPPLDGNNYHSWARSMRRALLAKNKFRFVDPTFAIPDNFDPLYPIWERCNNLVHSWLLNSIIPNIKQSVVFVDSDVDVWSDFKERFSGGDLVRVSELQHELYSFKQNSLSVNEYFTKVKVLWEELENYRLLHACVCA